MTDVILKLINGLSIENILWLLFGAALGAIGVAVVTQLPDILNAILGRTKRIEDNQYLLADNDHLLANNDREIANLIIAFARSLKVQLNEPTIKTIKTIEKRNEDDF